MPRMMTPRHSMTQSGKRTTPFGAVENPGLLTSANRQNTIHRVDLLTVLKHIWGESIMKCRAQLYKLVSGSCTDIELHQYLKFFYLRCPSFSNFVTREYYFGDQSKPLIRRIIEPARDRINSYHDQLCKLDIDVIGVDEDYIYFYATNGLPTSIEEVAEVC